MAVQASCPFCGITSPEVLAIELHIQQEHTEYPHNSDHRPKVAREHPSDMSPKQKRCSRLDCGELIPPAEIDEHEAWHMLTDDDNQSHVEDADGYAMSTRSGVTSLGGTTKRYEVRPSTSGIKLPAKPSNSSRRQSRKEPTGKQLKQPRRPERLGKPELGPYAFEKAMPPDVRKQLTQDALPHYSYRIGNDGKLCKEVSVENETPGLIRLLSDLCALDTSIETTYLCHSNAKHIARLKCDGNFCGYWNIQMLLSFLMDTNSVTGVTRLPDVTQIQDSIEDAWDAGICTYGRIETGGIRNTRKWIGTHEALAYFTQMGIDVQALSFKEEGEYAAEKTVISMLDYVEAYFIAGSENARIHKNSRLTQLPPIYFQRAGHSMTIVGLERKKNGFRRLLLFDPSFQTTDSMKKLLAGQKTTAKPEALLSPYRKSDESLTKWNEFELIVPKMGLSEACRE